MGRKEEIKVGDTRLSEPVVHCARKWDTRALCGVIIFEWDTPRVVAHDDLSEITCQRCKTAVNKIRQEVVRDLESQIARLQKALQDDITDEILHSVDRALAGRQGFARGGRPQQLRAA